MPADLPLSSSLWLELAVLKRISSLVPVFNLKYLDFSSHYGFRIVPCGVRKSNEKGLVENAIGHMKKNFLTTYNEATGRRRYFRLGTVLIVWYEQSGI